MQHPRAFEPDNRKVLQTESVDGKHHSLARNNELNLEWLSPHIRILVVVLSSKSFSVADVDRTGFWGTVLQTLLTLRKATLSLPSLLKARSDPAD